MGEVEDVMSEEDALEGEETPSERKTELELKSKLDSMCKLQDLLPSQTSKRLTAYFSCCVQDTRLVERSTTW